ncbi:hypothetical protein A3E89_01585 [Candidatus Campbellbacteria bacterium RIFCSPHIGHO2_12_FULL_35_10]|uniref:Major facilitator superfamily (MFS) profile domain-containing protein n=1 Tax=Candidatus Campbellbacteria bacterium RIFCSPHIGHO2_12_FULL_35_10 TaxID=1797578 RepID=A0A1F5EPX6_9BACT|nr:MAG: hypothetical protein A3E89_01585 [Candidatus Campbellbacteria bacterium RIFCSPHIGHO2_12_FULL_35_10]
MSTEQISSNRYFNIKSVSSVVRYLTLADLFFLGGLGLIGPIFAVYIVETIPGANVDVVGMAMMIYLITKSFAQIPIGNFLDKMKGEKDDFWLLFTGFLLCSIIPLLYLQVNTAGELYLIEFFYGLFAALAFPSWYSIFTRHIDRGKEGLEWGTYNTLIDLGGAFSAGIGGLIAANFGFDTLFILSSVAVFIGALSLLFIYKEMKVPEVKK